MAVLVTGGAGYVGSATVAALAQQDTPVVVLDSLSAGHRGALPREVPFYEGDMADGTLLERIFGEHGITQVMHFSALTSVPDSVAQPDLYFRNNTVKTLALLDAMKRAGIGQFVFSSTAAVYGEPQEIPIPETHPTAPTNPYGHSKRFVELALEAYGRAFGLRWVALRYFNAAGGAAGRGEDHQPETHLIPIVLQAALGQRAGVSIFGNDYPTPDGTCVRDYVHVDDLALAHLAALGRLREGGEGGIFNLGNGQGYTNLEVVQAAREVTGRAIEVRFEPRRPGDPSCLVASSAKARSELGWRPCYPDLRQIVESAWQWHSTHPQGYGDR